jgi:hypothetical protein
LFFRPGEGIIGGMDRKTRHDFEMPRFSYGAVESALAAVFAADRKTQQGALRGRLKHLQRLGLGIAAGKGARVHYTLAQASQWLLAMLMNEIGVDPAISVPTIKKAWPQLQRWFERSLDKDALGGNPIWLTLRPQPMSGWAKAPAIEWIGAFRWKEMRSKQQPYNLLNAANDLEWVCTRNLSVVMLKFVEALEPEEK